MLDRITQGSTNQSRRRQRRFALVGALALSSVLVLSACAPGSQGSSGNAGGVISTTVPKDKKITLNLAHWEVGGNAKAIDELISAYEAKHSNVTIKTSFASFTDYGQRVKLQMSAKDAPDIAEAGQAFTMMAPLVQGKLLRPLDDYAKLYGWKDRFGPGLLDQSRMKTDGSKFGTGDLYGLALGGNMVGVFYNRSLVKELGIDPNFADLASFQDALSAAQKGGHTPIELGNADAWPANHLLSSLVSQYVDQKKMLSWIYGDNGASFTDAQFQKATTTLAEWAQKGYIDPAANGLSNDDAINRFSSGKAAFFITGNWSLDAFAQKMGDNVGFTAFPGLKAGAPLRATGATTSPFTISSKSKYPDVAANFLDFMTGPESAKILANGGYAPLTPGAEVKGSSQLISDYNKVWAKTLGDDGLTLYLDWSTVAMGNTLFPGIQELIAGKTTPQQLDESVQAEWKSGRS